jgi:glycosidase
LTKTTARASKPLMPLTCRQFSGHARCFPPGMGILHALPLLLVVGACKSPYVDGQPDASGGDDAGDTVPVRGCATRFELRPEGPVDGVALAGEWDWTAREPLTDPDGDGVFTLDKDLAPGIWAYKFVTTIGGTEHWDLDPVNRYRAYDGGVENSGMRVEDCATPLVSIVSHSIAGAGATTRLALWRGSDGAAIDSVRAVRRFEGQETAVDVGRTGGELSITLADLARGKHTLVVDVTAANGLASTPVVIPFWIEDETYDWRDALIYMVMTDRFRNANPANDPGPSAGADSAAEYLGGDLQGVTAAIEDGTLDALGVTALWLSPFGENTPRVHHDGTHGVTAYHGYWPTRARAVDPRLGTEADLDALVIAAHRRGIRVLMDFVINHVHEDHEYYAAHPDWFRTGCTCGTPGCDWTDQRLECLFKPYLPDVNWQGRDASEQMIEDAMWWLERFDLDGLRVDAVKHVEDLAIFNLSTRIHDRFELGGTEYFLLGETAMGWSGDSVEANLEQYATISRYIGDRALDGQFDFVLHHATASRVWADDDDGMFHLDFWTRQSLLHYPADAIMTPFVGSHDSSRVMSRVHLGSGAGILRNRWSDEPRAPAPTTDEPYDRVAIALAWTLTAPGAPLLYYGDEYGEHGGDDPDNRHWWVPAAQRDARQTSLHARVARVGQLRRELPELRRGDYAPLTVTEDVLAFSRTYQGRSAIVVINHAGASRQIQITVPADLASAATLVDRLDPGGRTMAVSAGAITVDMAGRTAAVLTR